MGSTKKAEPFVARLGRALAGQAPPAPAPRRYAVAFSGGLDSTVLLHAMTRLPAVGPLRALHVDHGLAAESGAWARHCRAAAAALGVAYQERAVHVERRGGAGIEAAARTARYGALGAMLEAGEVLLTAHHADDQLETVLLRLLRGAGVEGLAATHALAPFARGYLARPMLEFTRGEIRAQAERWRLTWLDDPSNADLRYDRNFLRAEVLPALRERWPAAGRSAVRLARQMQQTQAVLAAMAEHDLGAADPGRLSGARLRALPVERRRNLLRYAIRRSGLPMPSARQLEQLDAGLDVRRPDASTRVAWPGAEARVYRDHVYLGVPLAPLGGAAERAGRIGLGRPWAGAAGRVDFVPAADAVGLPERWLRDGLTLRFRRGGERLRPVGREHSRPLKKWLQEAGIVPWMRERIPLLYRDEELVAVGDLWLADAVRDAGAGAPRWRVLWTDHPPLH
jgi:tRNA(Ile)-lysidine synthase